MKRFIIVTILVTLVAASQSFALIGLRVGANANITQPSATIAFDQYTGESFSPTGFGVTAFGVADVIFFKITADVGYINFGEQSYEYNIPVDLAGATEKVSVSAKVTAIPILVGLRWELGLPIGPKFHFGFQTGLHNFTYTYEGSAFNEKLVDETETTSEFSFAPIIGLRWSSVEASLLYMVVKDFNYVGLRVGYSFGFGI